MKLRVGVPFAKHGMVTKETMNSLRTLEQCPDFETEVLMTQGSNVPLARNNMVNNNRSNLVHQKLDGFDYLLCVDADTGFTPDHIHQLLKHDLDIVSGAYPMKLHADRFAAGWFGEVRGLSPMDSRVPIDSTGLLEVDWVGCGFLLVRREALEAIPYPWFSYDEARYVSDKAECAVAISEDIGFCLRAQNSGFKIHLDADCRVEHVSHPNERTGSQLLDALNDLLYNRETIAQHVSAMSKENARLRAMLSDQEPREE